MNWRTVSKALVAAAGVLAVLGKVLADGDVSAGELGEIAGALAVALGVYFVPNKQET